MGYRGQERRAFARVRADIPAQVVLTDGPEPVTAETVNLSGSGACFALPRPIPPGTCLLISLIVPEVRQDGVENHFCDFEGVVVRNESPEDGEEDQYRVAVHFTGADEATRTLIDRFVRDKLQVKQP